MSDEATPDFPAAHSMDSAWFAVDADGRVGRFDTGEDGAIPNAAAGAGGNYEPDFDLLLVEALLAGLALRGTAPGATATEDDDPPAPASPPPARPEGPRPDQRVVIVGVPSLDDVGANYRAAPRPTLRAEATFRDGELVEVKAADPRILVSRDRLPAARVDALRAFGDATVLVEAALYEVLREGERSEEPAAGVFEYRHRFDGKGSGTYEQTHAPREAVSLDDVHPSVRERLGSLRLPLQFAASPVVELADHLGEDDVQTYGTPLDPANAPPAPPMKAGGAGPDFGAQLVAIVVAVCVVVLLVLAVSGRIGRPR